MMTDEQIRDAGLTAFRMRAAEKFNLGIKGIILMEIKD